MSGGAAGRASGLALRLLLALTVGVIALEAALQIGARFVTSRAAPSGAGQVQRILAVGDSHTYGVIVPPDETYPAQLQRLLDRERPGHFEVVNLGIPGSSTGQVLDRLPRAIERYEPQLILLWCGVNNAWNRTGNDAARESTPSGGLASWLEGSRVLRLVRVLLSAPSTGTDLDAAVAGRGRPQQVERIGEGDVAFRVDHGDGPEIVQHDRPERVLDEDEAEARGYADYVEIVKRSVEYDIPVVFVRYPLEVNAFGAANRAMERASREYGIPLVATREAVDRVPKARREWLWGAHPNGPMYGEVARELLPVVLRELDAR